VTAPRYTMPTDQILSTFPPANGEGAFGDKLPQIVLKRRTLPWERNPAGGTAVSSTPWLALVVVAEGEGELSVPTPVDECVTNGLALDPSDKDVDSAYYLAVTASVVEKVFPTEEDLPLLVHVREVDVTDTELANGDDDGWLAVVIANRLPVMDTAAGKPVRYLACLVNLEGQLDELPEPSQPEEFFGFGLVQDWRFLEQTTIAPEPDHVVMGTGLASQVQAHNPGAPRAAGLSGLPTTKVGAALDGAAANVQTPRSTDWLTSVAAVNAAALDPDAQLLVRDVMGSGWRSPISKYAVERVLRFPVLAHWSFTTTEGATFETLMQGLDVGLLGTLEGERFNPPADAPAEPVEPPPAPRTSQVLETGHVHLQHRTRRGDRSEAWYRGPLVPHPTLREQPVGGKITLAHASDQLRRVVPDGGEDLSYAGAFEIGRLLALSQLSIVSALLRFRGEQFGRERARQVTDTFVPFDDLLANGGTDLSRFVSHTLMEQLAVKPGATLGPPRPVVDPGRPVASRADLDTALATGLGLDLEVLRRNGEKVGYAAALAASVVPVAVPERGEVDEVTIKTLQGALETTLAAAVRIALPDRRGPGAAPPAAQPPPARRAGRARAAAPAPDALDELIAGAAEHADRDPAEP
jgi:hypothetical protein